MMYGSVPVMGDGVVMRKQFIIFLFGVAGCFASPADAGAPARTPEARFQALETYLLQQPYRLRFAIGSSGAFTAALNGTLEMRADNTIHLTATGHFGDAPVTLTLDSDGKTLRGGNGEKSFEIAAPPQLREALVIGLTRMGLLHNLARLVAGKAPDHMAGGVREWVRVSNMQHRLPLAADAPPDDIFMFDIEVANQPAGTARLVVDATTRLPRERTQTVEFETGSMKVTERYRVY